MKFTSILLSLAAISAQAVDVENSKHSFNFKDFVASTPAAKNLRQHQRKLHSPVNHVLNGRKNAGSKQSRSPDIMDSEECQSFADRMMGVYPELYYDDIFDYALFACNPLTYSMLLQHYSMGVGQPSSPDEPQVCVDAFSSMLTDVIVQMEMLHTNAGFCSYQSNFVDECYYLELSEGELELLDSFSPEEVTDLCTTGDIINVGEAFLEILSGPAETDECMVMYKQIIVDMKVELIITAMADPVCVALFEGKSGKSGSKDPRSNMNCLAPGMCV